MNKFYPLLLLFAVSFTAKSQQPWLWTWIGGDKSHDAAGIYGSQGKSLPLNIPGSRAGAATWVDDNGNFWLFGGVGSDKNGQTGYLNDLWKYNPSSHEWTWVGGADIINQWGRYGKKEIASTDNHPGARKNAVAWQDGEGNFWLFGGLGVGARHEAPEKPEPPAEPEKPEPPAEPEKPEPPQQPETPEKPQPPGGEEKEEKEKKEKEEKEKKEKEEKKKKEKEEKEKKEKEEKEEKEEREKKDKEKGKKGSGDNSVADNEISPEEGLLNDLWMYSPVTGKWTWVSGEPYLDQKGRYGQRTIPGEDTGPGSRYQSAGWADDQNNLWLFGGRGYSSVPGIRDMNDLWKFSLSARTWTWMNGGSPESVAPPGRRASTPWIDDKRNFWLFGGGSETELFNDVWKYNPGDNSWQPVQATTGPGSRMLAEGWADGDNNLWIFGGDAYDNTSGTIPVNALWRYSIDENKWTLVKGQSLSQPHAVYGTRGTSSENNNPGGTSDAACWQSQTGDIYIFGGQSSEGYLNTTWKLAPSKGDGGNRVHEQKVAVPTAFTPNGNNVNDMLRPLGDLSSLDFFRIYNRWGKIVFQTNVIGAGWDGKCNGLLQASETYTWLLSGKTTDGQPVKLSGKTVLIR